MSNILIYYCKPFNLFWYFSVSFFQDGVSVFPNGIEFHFKGSPVLFLGDTPASACAGSFKCYVR